MFFTGKSSTVDLVAAARALIAFLRLVHCAPGNTAGELYRASPEFEKAVHAYRAWMGRAAVSGAAVVPPPSLEVAWVWLLHRLAPQHYVADCCAFAGRVIDCNPADPFGYKSDAALCTSATGCMHSEEAVLLENISVDLAACAERQGGFLWQVRWGEYEQIDFLRRAVARYGMLFGLWASRDSFLVPTYDMDLMWHAHMAHPVAYVADCQRVAKRLISHDDSVTLCAPYPQHSPALSPVPQHMRHTA